MLSLILDAQTDVELRAGIWLAWKTASRWDDIFDLPLPLTYDPTKAQLLVAYLGNTKASAEHPYQPRFLAVVDWNHHESMAPPPDVLEFLTRPGTGRRLCHFYDTIFILRFLRKVKVPLELQGLKAAIHSQSFPDHFTAHSFKKGAIRILWSKVSEESLITPMLIERIAKHKNPNGEPLSEEAVRYAPDLFPVARSLGTQHVSRAL